MNRIKKASVVCIFILAVIPLHAQWDFGGVIDFNLSGICVKPGSSSEDYSGIFGFGIGFVFDRALTDRIFLHAEPLYLQKGGRIKTIDVNLAYKVNYLEFPILIKYAFNEIASLTPYALTGPNIGLRLGAEYKDKQGREQDETDNTSFFDLGVGLGGGVSYLLENITLFGETRYVIGLANINNESDESTVKNRGLQIVFGFTIPVEAK